MPHKHKSDLKKKKPRVIDIDTVNEVLKMLAEEILEHSVNVMLLSLNDFQKSINGPIEDVTTIAITFNAGSTIGAFGMLVFVAYVLSYMPKAAGRIS